MKDPSLCASKRHSESTPRENQHETAQQRQHARAEIGAHPRHERGARRRKRSAQSTSFLFLLLLLLLLLQGALAGASGLNARTHLVDQTVWLVVIRVVVVVRVVSAIMPCLRFRHIMYNGKRSSDGGGT
jgi:hypothetical protein